MAQVMVEKGVSRPLILGGGRGEEEEDGGGAWLGRTKAQQPLRWLPPPSSSLSPLHSTKPGERKGGVGLSRVLCSGVARGTGRRMRTLFALQQLTANKQSL